MVVPEMYARNAGITGNMHGARNDPRPAKAAIAIVISCMIPLDVILLRLYSKSVPNCFTGL